MNYIELDLGGEKRGAKLGIGFLRYVTEEKKITVDEFFKRFQDLGANPNIESIYDIINILYISLVYNCKRKSEQPNFTQDDVFDWIDEDGGFSSPIFQYFMESLGSSLGADLGKKTPQKKVVAKK